MAYPSNGGTRHPRLHPQGPAARARAALPEGFDFAALLERHEGALVRLGQLEGERERRLALEGRCGALEERAARADLLAGEVTRLRRERWALGLLALLAVGGLVWALLPALLR